MMKKMLLSVMALVLSCHAVTAQKSIVILYENDVHCGIDGYTKMAGLRDAIEFKDTAYVGLVCCGDFLQGNTTGAISKGKYIADIMKLMDYHAITLGNHEFDYGVPRLRELLKQIDAPSSVPISLRQVSSIPSMPPTSSISMAIRRWPLLAPAPLRR